MTVTVTPNTPATAPSQPAVAYSNGVSFQDDFGTLTVYAGPEQPVAIWAKGTWQNAVIS